MASADLPEAVGPRMTMRRAGQVRVILHFSCANFQRSRRIARAMAARISAPRIWVRLRFTAVTVAQSEFGAQTRRGKRNCDRKRAGEPRYESQAQTPAVRKTGLARVH